VVSVTVAVLIVLLLPLICYLIFFRLKKAKKSPIEIDIEPIE
jgi:hypothetical protein